jgi:hypothetical protein
VRRHECHSLRSVGPKMPGELHVANEWYIARAGQRLGPYSSSQLREFAQGGQLQPTDLIWKQGMTKWKAANKAKGLFQPPPVPAESTEGPAGALEQPAWWLASTGGAAESADSLVRPAATQSRGAAEAVNDAAAPATIPTPGPRIKLTPGKLGCLAVVAILFIIAAIVKLINPDFGEDTPVAAWGVARSFVEKKLRSPTSASFPWYDKSFVTQLPDEAGKKRYRITAYVDAQNAFGATIRTNFTCTVKYAAGKNLVWHLETLDFDTP